MIALSLAPFMLLALPLLPLALVATPFFLILV